LRPAWAKVSETLSEKQNKTKSQRTGGMAQVAQHLPSKHKTLGLIFSPAKKKKKTKKTTKETNKPKTKHMETQMKN
jgi:hypothetical protein